MICIDSTFVIDYLRAEPNAVEKAEEFWDEELVTTTVNCFEAISGILKSDTKQDELDSFEKLMAPIRVLDFDYRAAYEAARVFLELEGIGRRIGGADCMVAGAMLSNGCRKILTRNKKHFSRIAGIEIETY